ELEPSPGHCRAQRRRGGGYRRSSRWWNHVRVRSVRQINPRDKQCAGSGHRHHGKRNQLKCAWRKPSGISIEESQIPLEITCTDQIEPETEYRNNNRCLEQL